MLCAGSSTFNQALFNSVNILMGVGLLSIPYALKEVSRQHHFWGNPCWLMCCLTQFDHHPFVQGGWASLGVLGLLWACTNYTGKPHAFVHGSHMATCAPHGPAAE